MSDDGTDPTPHDDSALRHAQDAIDEAKDAATRAGETGADRLIDEDDAPVAGDTAPADGPAPAS